MAEEDRHSGGFWPLCECARMYARARAGTHVQVFYRFQYLLTVSENCPIEKEEIEKRLFGILRKNSKRCT